MDDLGAFLDGPRAHDAFLLRATLDPPWSVRIEDRAPISLMAVASGSAWIVPEDGAPLRLEPGDVALARWDRPYVVADAPDTAPMAVILEDQRCQTVDGIPLDQSMSRGVRTWGNSPDGSDVMLIGSYHNDGEISRRLLAALPPFVIVRADEWDSPLLAVLEIELARDELGQSVVLDRLLDLLLVGTLRTWLARPDTKAPGWYRALADPVVGDALRLLHDDPAAPWSVGSLAARVGVSRATLARRFTELVGEPPMTYLTDWRLSLAADRLREPGASVGAVAAEVGYGSAFAFSSAFKRNRGVSPREHLVGAHG